jgi:predicted Zn-dependent peptidase
VTETELEAARGQAIAALGKQLDTKDGTADAWLDVDTHSAKSGDDRLRELGKISSDDVKRAANRLFWDVPVAVAVIGNSEALKPQLERVGKIELFGELPAAANAKKDPATNKQQTKPNP